MVESRGSGAAHRALEVFNDGQGSSKLPVDPVSIARSLGINVFQAKLENTLSGMIAKLSPDGDTNIFLNTEHAPVRQRFTCAHELGHYFAIRNDPNRAAATFIHRRDSLSACGANSEEIYANQFAAELLMPRQEVSKATSLGMDVYARALRFNVSLDAMSLRLRNLNLA